MTRFWPMLALGLSLGAIVGPSVGRTQPQRGARISALFAEQAAGAVRLSWAMAHGSEGATLELSRDGAVIWKGVSDHFVDQAPSGKHVYRLSGAGSAREVAVTALGGPCVQPPSVTLDEPFLRWIALNNVAEIKISGSVSQPAGCAPAAVSFRVLGPDAYERSGDLGAPRDGGFHGLVYVDASLGPSPIGTPEEYWKDAKDYLIEVKAVNEKGEAVSARRRVRVQMRPPLPAYSKDRAY